MATIEQTKLLVSKYAQGTYVPVFTINGPNGIVEKIYKDFESRICGNCTWYKDEVCTNDESPLCCDFVIPTFGCNLFEYKD